MQMKIWSPWKIVAACAAAGLLAAIAFSLLTPDRYVSHAVLKIENGGADEVNAGAEKILSRHSLVQLINKEDLYKSERTRMPIEDLVEEMKNHDIIIRPGAPGEFVVSFAAPDAARAQRTTQWLAAAFVDANVGTLLDPANLPISPNGPRRSRIIVLGMVAGILAGVLFALFNGLKVWKLAAGLGIAGAVLCAAISYGVPDSYMSTAVVRYDGGDAARMQQLIHAVTNDASLYAMVVDFGLYLNDPRAQSKLREHIRIQTSQNAKVVMIQFEYADRYTAQKVTQQIVQRLIDESLKTDSGMKLEMLQAAGLPLTPYFPYRPKIAGYGLFVGLACAVLLGVRRHYKTPLPVVAAR